MQLRYTCLCFLLFACGAPSTQREVPRSVLQIPIVNVSAATETEPKHTFSFDWDDSASPVPITSRDPMWGNRDALVTMVLYSDFECPSCAFMAKTTEELKENFKKDQLRIVWKDCPLAYHAHALDTAVAAKILFSFKGPDAFWRFHDLAFANQKTLDATHFEEWASSAGLSEEEKTSFKTTYARDGFREKIQSEVLIAQKNLKLNGVPASCINGIRLDGGQTLPDYQKVIDEQLALATEKARVVPREKLYVTLSRENYKKP